MAQVTFVLKEPNSKEDTLVYLILRYNSNRFKYSTGQKIKPKFWNSQTQKARETSAFSGYAEFNNTIDNLGVIAMNRYRELINDKVQPTSNNLRIPLDEFLQKSFIQEKRTLLDFIKDYIEASNNSFHTIKQYKTALKHLKGYKSEKNIDLNFENITLDFYESFMSYLIEKQYSTNSIGTIIKNIKVFMNEAVERKLTANIQYKSKKFKVVQEPSENIYLTNTELDNIYKLDLSKNIRLDKVRDLFLIGCYTGLRFADLVQLRDENLIDKGNKIKLKTSKTGEVVIIPLNTRVKEILKKYSGVPPQVISNQKMNEYLKELGEAAEINIDVLINSTKGGIKNKEVFKKYQLITVHTARRSFATNAYLADVPSISIMKITGHRSENAFLKYIKISQEDNANKLINHPFFK